MPFGLIALKNINCLAIHSIDLEGTMKVILERRRARYIRYLSLYCYHARYHGLQGKIIFI